MTTNWQVFQIGAREHYSIPRALNQLGRSVQLTTDVWVKPGQRWCSPRAWKSRWHSDLSDVRVTSWNTEAAFFEAKQRMFRSEIWNRNIARNKWFGKRASRALSQVLRNSQQPPILFAFSYAAREVFEIGKAHGCPCILGQIDPGPGEVRLVRELAIKHRQAASDEPPQAYWESWLRECELADRIVVNSPWSAELLSPDLPLPIKEANKLRVISLAFERTTSTTDNGKANLFEGYPDRFTEERPLRVLFLGQVILRKGVKELTEGIRALAHEPVTWTVIGTGDPSLMAELSSCPNTRVLGGLSRQFVADWYKRSDLFILPTHSDGYAITQLEAAAYGLPIITSGYCGQVVEDGVNGLLLSEVSGEAIASAVRQLVRCPAKLTAMRVAQNERPGKTLVDLQFSLAELEADVLGHSQHSSSTH